MWYATASDLMLKFRRDVYDNLEGVDDAHPDSENLWSNEDVYGYMTHAADAVARGTKQLTKILELPFKAGDKFIVLPRYVLDIMPGTEYLSTGKTRMFDANSNDQPFGISDDYGQRTTFVPAAIDSVGRPSRYIRDMGPNGNIRLVTIPQEDDTFIFTATVTLSYPFTDGTEPLPFRDLPDFELMLDYMKYRAYLKQDSEALDERKSAFFKATFDRNIKDRESEIRRMRHPVSRVRACF